eukprot:1156274-Pelagomonas_calceolata.AAC.4
MARLVQGMGRTDIPLIPRGLCGEWSWHLEGFCTVHCVVAVRLLAGHQDSCLAGVVLLLASSLPLTIRSTRCEGELSGLFGFVGQGVTKTASGRLELRPAPSEILGSKRYGGRVPEGIANALICMSYKTLHNAAFQLVTDLTSCAFSTFSSVPPSTTLASSAAPLRDFMNQVDVLGLAKLVSACLTCSAFVAAAAVPAGYAPTASKVPANARSSSIYSNKAESNSSTPLSSTPSHSRSSSNGTPGLQTPHT